MPLDFTFEECRVLGVLLEKELATPDYYPMTLNSLTTGCNQKSNRDPVVAFSETDTMAALDLLACPWAPERQNYQLRLNS